MIEQPKRNILIILPKNTPLEGMMILNEINSTTKKYKQKFLLKKDELGLTEFEIYKIIDEASNKISKKYLKT